MNFPVVSDLMSDHYVAIASHVVAQIRDIGETAFLERLSSMCRQALKCDL